MSLQWQLSRTVPEDTLDLGQVLLRPQNLYRQLGDRFDSLFPDEMVFMCLYAATGRGAISPLLLSLVTIFQAMEKLPDRIATEYAVSRIDWKYAMHLALTYTGFHFTDLLAFRTRLQANQQDRLVFDQVLSKLKEAGLIKKRGKMRTDSTHMLAVIDRLSRLELVTESLRLALEAVCDLVPVWVSENISSLFLEMYSERRSDYRLSDAVVQQKLIQAGQDGVWFLVQWDRAVPVPADQVPEAIMTLRTVLTQQFPPQQGGTPPAERPRGADVIDSPHEPEARTAAKRGKPWTGYKMHVTETCDDDQPRLITDITATNACVPDNNELPQIQERLVAQDTTPDEQFGDMGYISGKNLVASTALGIKLMGCFAADSTNRPGFQQADFSIDEKVRVAHCPAGQTSTYWHEGTAPAGGQQPVKIRFDAMTCLACPCFGRCTTSKRGRSLGLSPYRLAITARRVEAKSAAFRDAMHVRAGVEGTISQLVRTCGLRYARYRGLRKVRMQCFFSGIAVNLKRLVRWLVTARPSAGGLAVA